MSKYFVQVEFSRLVGHDVAEAIRLAYDKFVYEQDEKPAGLLINSVSFELLRHARPELLTEGPSIQPQYMGMVVRSKLDYPLDSVFVVDQENLDTMLVRS